MSLFSQVASKFAQAATPVVPDGTIDLQQVYDFAIAGGKVDEGSAVLRLREFFGKPLHDIRYTPDSFDADFPRVARADLVPGRDRSFWRTKDGYNRWRQKVHKQIEHATGLTARTAALRTRRDGWSGLLTLLKALTLDGGPIHCGEYGAIVALADRLRRKDIEPDELTRSVIEDLLAAAPSSRIRGKMIRALQLLERYAYISSVAAFLPDALQIEAARRRFENGLPEKVELELQRLVEVAAYDEDSLDETTGQHSKRRATTTLDAYHSALRSYAASAERAGAVDLDRITDISALFTKEVFYPVVRYWTDTSENADGLCARSAFNYCGSIGVVLGRNAIVNSHITKSMKTNPFLQEGSAATKTMAPKVKQFCAPIVRNKAMRRRFLTQHIAYRAQAEDMLATDKVLSGLQLQRLRAIGTCAAVAAVEIAGAPFRILNTLQLRHRGPTANVLLPSKLATHFLITISAAEMKAKKPMPPVKLRSNALQGEQTLSWYLKTIRPLFPYGNSLWCNSEEDEVDPRVRFGIRKDGQKQAESIYLFVAPDSAAHLSKSVFYDWIVEASDAYGMPMSAHRFRCGLASVLMSRSLANAGRVAKLLNNTVPVVMRHYAWIHDEAVIEETQNEILEEVR